MMLRETSQQLTGNERFEGFCVDLVREIAEILGFNYTFKLVEDGNYGIWDKTQNRYNGMIGELLSQVGGVHFPALSNLHANDK